MRFCCEGQPVHCLFFFFSYLYCSLRSSAMDPLSTVMPRSRLIVSRGPTFLVLLLLFFLRGRWAPATFGLTVRLSQHSNLTRNGCKLASHDLYLIVAIGLVSHARYLTFMLVVVQG